MKVLFVHAYLSSFTRRDLQTIQSEHVVRELHSRGGAAGLVPTTIAAVKGALWADAVVAWFGTGHALLPFAVARLRGRPCFVIAGGYDVAVEPDIAYGNMRPGIRRVIGRAVFALATRVLAVSEAAARDARTHAGVPPEKIEVIVHGIADEPLRPMAPPDGRRTALTISIVNHSNLLRKGLSTFIEAARHLPHVPFVLVGGDEDGTLERLKRDAPANVEFTGFVDDAELARRLDEAAVYVQVSGHEAFGVALAEAMLAGSVPVVTERGSLPEVVGDTGFYVPFGDPATTARAIDEAFADRARGGRARERIRGRFPKIRRRERLLAALREHAS